MVSRFPGALPGKASRIPFVGGPFSGITEYVATHFNWHRFAAIQTRIFVLFLIYTSIEKLNARLGDGGLIKIFFPKRSPVMKPPRCRRIRAAISRLWQTGTHMQSRLSPVPFAGKPSAHDRPTRMLRVTL